jgi:hypothetical protein
MCDAQLVRREDYQSLSVLGLALVCTIGGLIIFINLTLESIVGWYQHRHNKRGHAMQEWDMLQAETLQRHFYMSQGADLRVGHISVADILDGLKVLRRNDTMDTLVGNHPETRSMSSEETLCKEHSIGGRMKIAASKSTITVHSSV